MHEVGTLLVNARYPDLVKKITEVRETGYTWSYLDVPERDFWSENSSDPFFEMGWKVIPEISKDA